MIITYIANNTYNNPKSFENHMAFQKIAPIPFPTAFCLKAAPIFNYSDRTSKELHETNYIFCHTAIPYTVYLMANHP